MSELENSLPEQPSAKGGPEKITPPQAGTSFLEKLKSKWPVVLGILGSIAIFAALAYAGYWYGTQ